MSLKAHPNCAHYALAELARRKDFLTVSQNVDGLSQRAFHPASTLKLIHGSLSDLRCNEFFCEYTETNNFTDPIVPALALPTDESDPTTTEARRERELDIADETVALPEVSLRDLPRCPKCKTGLLRPGVVWFGELLPKETLRDIEEWIEDDKNIDLVMVIGTSSRVYPAAGYVESARKRGARVAVVNMDPADEPAGGMYPGDWFFRGDASEIVPEILKSVIGEVEIPS